MPFSVGDQVKLKSGGPVMTVTGAAPTEDSEVTVSWFDADHNYHTASIPLAALAKVHP